MSEFISALRHPNAYNPLRNVHALIGLLWGVPVPLFSIGLDWWVGGHPWERPIHLFFLAHPLMFMVVFGAMGVVRSRKDDQIQVLVSELERHVDELAKANERLLELDHLKAQFVANVTHELKTPLAAIRGYNESILEERFGPLTPKQRDGLGVAVRNVERLQKLIDELLEFERIDAGEFTIEASDFDLVPLVQSTIENFRPQLDQKRLRVELRLPPKLPVQADREKIARVLLNLVSNAVKFSGDGTAIGVNAAEEAGAKRVDVTVWDRGEGIPTAAQKFLFTRFWQADASTRRKHGGSGLGLAICKGILEAHGSAIEVVSSEGAGTMVHFTLPLAQEVPHGNGEGVAAVHPGR